MSPCNSFTNIPTELRGDVGVLRGYAEPERGVTKRGDHEESLEKTEERFRLLVDGASCRALFMLDPNDYVITWNSDAQNIKGYSVDEIIGRHFCPLYSETRIEARLPEHELRLAADTGRFVTEGWRVGKDGSQFGAYVVMASLRDRCATCIGSTKLTRDASHHRRYQAIAADGMLKDEMLRAERIARIEAQRARRIQDDFLATLSHELRTPVSATLAWAQVLRKCGNANPEALERGLAAIERNTLAQAHLIDDLLDLRRLALGRIRLDLQDVNISGVARGAVESAQPLAQAKGITLNAVLASDSAMIVGDPARLQQIFGNLLGNAIKFTHQGGPIDVVLRRMDSHIEIRVTDNGIGIAEAFLPQVFDRFSQKEGETTRTSEGLGLGLAISKQFVDLHGGTITATSPGEGKGSTFVVVLPLATRELATRTSEISRPVGDADHADTPDS